MGSYIMLEVSGEMLGGLPFKLLMISSEDQTPKLLIMWNKVISTLEAVLYKVLKNTKVGAIIFARDGEEKLNSFFWENCSWDGTCAIIQLRRFTSYLPSHPCPSYHLVHTAFSYTYGNRRWF